MYKFLSRFSTNICILVLFAGCSAIGPDYKQPEVDVEASWSEDIKDAFAEEIAEKENPRWWESFNDETLNRLIELSYSQNLDLRTAGIRIYEARALLGVAFGQYYPQTGMFGFGAKTKPQSKTATNFSILNQSVETAGIGFDASWELDIWGRNRRRIESASATYQSSIANYDDLLISVTAEVARTYIQYKTLQQRIKLAEENIKLQERSLEIVDAWYIHGGKTELDIQQAKALLYDTRALVPLLEMNLKQTENALVVLLGTTESQVKPILLSSQSSIPVGPESVSLSAPADLIRRRPDVRSAELLAISQSAQIGVAKADLYPAFTLTGSVGLSVVHGIATLAGGPAGSQLVDLFNADSLTYYAGGGFSWPIFNFGRIRNNVRANDARFEQAIETYRNSVLTAVKEVQNAAIGFVKAREQEFNLQKSVDAYARAAELSQHQYNDGAINYQSVVDSLRQLVQQQQSHIQVKGDIATNLVSMYKALGGGWQLKYDKGVVPANTLERMRERTGWGSLLENTSIEEDDPSEKAKHFPRPDL